MSQRRREARRAKQERRREERHQTRAAQRRRVNAERPTETALPLRQTLWTARNRWIALGSVAGLIVLGLAAWIFSSVRAPLPGEKFADLGADHLASSADPHEPYNSNPPASGPHTAPLPKAGIYTQPRAPEDLGHFMEHAGVWVLYNCPEGCESEVQELRGVVNRAIDRGRPVALAPFPSMGSRFATVSWRYLTNLDTFDRGAIDGFINRHACRFNPEGGPYCAGVRGKVQGNARKGEGTSVPIVSPTPFSVFGDQTPAPAASPAATPPR